MGWRLAKSLEKLRSQVNALAPKRSKVSDGTIGDARHRKSASDHNPRTIDGLPGIVSALDITHDPKNGVDCNIIAEAIKTDLRVKYVIWNKRIWNASVKKAWRPYHGVNPHNRHIHISVKPSKFLFDSQNTWNLTVPVTPQNIPVPLTSTEKLGVKTTVTTRQVLRRGMTGGDVPVLQLRLKELGYYPQLVDGDFGPQTEKSVKKAQEALGGLEVDGVVGPKTWAKLASAVVSAPLPVVTFPVHGLSASRKGIEHIKSFESCILTAHEVGGVWHIGWGRSNTSGKLPRITKGLTITQAQADEMFLDDLGDFEKAMKAHIKIDVMTQGQWDALVSMTYNKGPTWFGKSEILKAVNAKDWAKVAELILKEVPPVGHKFYRGLLRRRKAEVALLQG